MQRTGHHDARGVPLRHGPLRPGELAEAVVLADVSLALTVVGQVVPFGTHPARRRDRPAGRRGGPPPPARGDDRRDRGRRGRFLGHRDRRAHRHGRRARSRRAGRRRATGAGGAAAHDDVRARSDVAADRRARRSRAVGFRRPAQAHAREDPQRVARTVPLHAQPPPRERGSRTSRAIAVSSRCSSSRGVALEIRRGQTTVMHAARALGSLAVVAAIVFVLGGAEGWADDAVATITRNWWITVPVVLFVSIVFGIWLTHGLATPALRRVDNAFGAFGAFGAFAAGDRLNQPDDDGATADAGEPTPVPVRLDDVRFRYPNASTRCARRRDRSTSARGEMVAVVGANGSGKSTLARVIAGRQRTDGRARSFAPGRGRPRATPTGPRSSSSDPKPRCSACACATTWCGASTTGPRSTSTRCSSGSGSPRSPIARRRRCPGASSSGSRSRPRSRAAAAASCRTSRPRWSTPTGACSSSRCSRARDRRRHRPWCT